ncbi:MAG: AAA family ATPase [Patescibacteria group bacterium]
MIIGITGTLGAGKNSVVDYFKKRGFSHYSVREFLIAELKKRKMPLDRDNMRELANQLRAQNSPSYIAEQLYELARQQGQDCILESIRTPGEAEALKQKDKFYLIAVDADQRTRYDRIKKRENESDHVSWKKFVEQEAKEMTSDDPNKQNLSKCIAMSDFQIDNSGGYQELYKQVDKIIERIGK